VEKVVSHSGKSKGLENGILPESSAITGCNPQGLSCIYYDSGRPVVSRGSVKVRFLSSLSREARFEMSRLFRKIKEF